jgi:hypothetical protein
MNMPKGNDNYMGTDEMMEKTKGCERICGHFRAAIWVVLMVFGIALLLPGQALAWPGKLKTCSTAGCHVLADSNATIDTAFNGSLGTTGSAVAGETFELDLLAKNISGNGVMGFAVLLPTGWTVSAVGTNNSPGIPGWNNVWDASAGELLVSWSAFPAVDYPGSTDGYTLYFATTSWDSGTRNSAMDDATAGKDLDGLANTMGVDLKVSVPGGATPGDYTVQILAAGHEGTKAYVVQPMIITVPGGPDITSPTVVSSTPAKNDPSAPLNGAVTINFSEPIDCTTVNTTNVTMTAGGWSLGSCGGSTAVFNTSGQTGSTFYTVTVTTAVKDLAGNPLDPSNTLNVIGYITNAAATPPDTFITAPAAAAVLSGASFNITGTATPGTNPVAGVQLSTDNGGSWNAATGTESWSYLWTLPAEDYVSHTILAKAVDNTALEDLTPRSVSITVDTVAPAGLANSAPTNGATAVATGISLVAVAATDGNPTVEYLFELAGDAAFTVSPQTSSWQMGSSWAPVLAGGATYYWRVSVRDGAGNLAGPTATWTFQTAAGCSRLDPTVAILTASREITVDGGFADYTVQVVNNDSAACGNTTFNLSVSDSNGTNFYPSTLAQSALVVVPGGSSQTTFRVTAKANQPNSVTDNSDVTSVADGNHGAVASAAVTTTINVTGGGCVSAGSYLNGNGDQLTTSR